MSLRRGWKWHGEQATPYLSCYANGIEALRLTPSTTGVDVKVFGDTPASYFLNFDASGPRFQIPSGVELDCESGSTLTIAGTLTATDKIDSVHYAADSIDKEHLASEIYAIEPVCFGGSMDNQTVKIYKCWSACTVVRVCYFTDTALGSSVGIDVVDGHTDGSGATVIDKCDDNLNGADINSLSTPYALSAGDWINIKFDDFTGATNVSVIILLKVPLGDAT